MNKPWRSQLAVGRVFELRSKSTKYPAPCALMIDDDPHWTSRRFVGVDRYGVIGHGCYTRRHNPGIFVEGLRLEECNSSRIACRRPDLERFSPADLAMIRYGLAVDFSGCIRGSYSDMHIPMGYPADWTVFWLTAWKQDDYRWVEADYELRKLLSGAWHFESWGGSRHLGYRFGHLWATCHKRERLDQIKDYLFRKWGSGLIEQSVKVVRWIEGGNVYTEEVRRDCPSLGMRCSSVSTTAGTYGVYR